MWLEYSLIALVVAVGLKFGRRWIDMARGAKDTRNQRVLAQHLDWERHSESGHLRKSAGIFAKYNR